MNTYTQIKTNLTVFSFPNTFLSFKKQKPKKETKKSQYAISETPMYNYIQNMSIYIHYSYILLSFIKLLHSTASIEHN